MMHFKATIASEPDRVRLLRDDTQEGSQSADSRQVPRVVESVSAPRLYGFAGGFKLGGILVVLTGAVGLTGWLTGSRLLTAVRPGFIPVSPNTALLFVLLGASLCTFGNPSPRLRLFARPAIAFALLVAGTRLAEYIVGADFRVDNWLFSFPSDSFGLAPVGKMAFFTALNFSIACLGLFALTFERRRRSVDDVVRALALLVTLIGVVFALGYLYDNPLLYGTQTIPMALLTAVAFVVLGLSMAVPMILADRAERRRAKVALRMAHDQLELRVSERTTELKSANQHLQETVVVLEERTEEAERARQQAHVAQQRYHALVDGLEIGVVFASPDGFQANASAWRILGLSADEMQTWTALETRAIHEDGSPFPVEMQPVLATLRTGEAHRCVVLGVQRPDDTIAWVEVNSDPLFRPGDSTPYAAVASFVDITERKRSEQELRNSEEQLRQAQKMEAVGQLAGGVAHDFNNMLTAIKSYTDLLLMDEQLGENRMADLHEIRKAADRAAALTRQLLAFSRRQVMQLRPTDLNLVVSDLEGMLRRLMVGHVELVTALEPEPGLVRVDPGQIEHVLMNLVVNARDAMLNGGTITIRTEHVLLDAAYCATHATAQPGPNVMLAVADTGHGMDEATVRRIFEPFFTTKELGRGTGLGLSTVYGIVKQSGGHIWVYSEVGHGTVFKIYFPLVEGAAAQPAAKSGPPRSRPQGSETVLLVDDEETLRIPVRRFLEKSGYTVMEAGSGAGALQLCEEYEGRIDLVITDMMMPGMDGRELIEHVIHVRPAAKVLFTSGYADDQMIKSGLLDAHMAFIQKPFNLSALVAKVRDVLASPTAW